MQASLVDYKTGWYEVQLELTREDVAKLIRSLTNLQKSVVSAHFHCSSDLKGSGGIAEIEFALVSDQERGAFTLLELKEPETNLPTSEG